MVGGLWEQVMGNMVDASGKFYPSSSGTFSPNSKYYDSYLYDSYGTCDGATPANTGCKNHARGKLGDATRETLSTFGTSLNGAWYPTSYSHFPYATLSWFYRGGRAADGANAGVFSFYRFPGGSSWYYGFRVVLAG